MVIFWHLGNAAHTAGTPGGRSSAATKNPINGVFLTLTLVPPGYMVKEGQGELVRAMVIFCYIHSSHIYIEEKKRRPAQLFLSRRLLKRSPVKYPKSRYMECWTYPLRGLHGLRLPRSRLLTVRSYTAGIGGVAVLLSTQGSTSEDTRMHSDTMPQSW